MVWALPLSLAATQGIDVSFSSSGYLDVSVHRVPFHTLWIGVWMTGVFPAGFPHSDTCGSMDICSLPQLFAAYHVFHRLLVPRHPPCALFCLTFPSQYYALSVTKEYLALRGGPRMFSQGSTCLDLLWIPPCQLIFRLRGFHPLWPAFPKPFC